MVDFCISMEPIIINNPVANNRAAKAAATPTLQFKI